tara:strand:- start:125 stop:751 length:627 start_codon:yes stop_codon:yes gene_type:complete
MIRIFGDAIDDKIFPKTIKKFTDEEKNIIDKLINSILREDKKSELEKSKIKTFKDRADRITEEIYKEFMFKGKFVCIRFYKFYTNEKKTIDHLPSDKFSLGVIAYNGNAISNEGTIKKLEQSLKNDKSISGIFIDGLADGRKSPGFQNLEFFLKTPYPDYKPTTYLLGIRTRYEDQARGGDSLTNECKDHIKKFHLKAIKNAILKAVK